MWQDDMYVSYYELNENQDRYMRSEVYVTMNIKIMCRDVAPCSSVHSYQYFGGTYCLHLRGRTMMSEAGFFSETLYLCIKLYDVRSQKALQLNTRGIGKEMGNIMYS
jgi:hypothetical protein